MRFRSFLMSALVILISLSKASANIYTETRFTVAKEKTSPYRSVGFVVGPSKDVCVASLISRDLILTTADCFFDKDSGMQLDGLFRFAIGDSSTYDYKKPNYTFSKVVEVMLGTTEHGPFMPKSGRYAVSNYAIARIADPLGDKYGWLELCVKPYVYDWVKSCVTWPVPRSQVFGMISFIHDLKDDMVYRSFEYCEFKAHDDETGAFAHNCSSYWRGSPILTFPDPNDKSRASIVGIFSVAFNETTEPVPFSNRTLNIMTPSNQFYNTYRQMLARSKK